jgi:SAM-dependent methyltransferase
MMEFSKNTAEYKQVQLDERGPEFDYLCVDTFMRDIFSARALATAFETGLIDALVKEPVASVDTLGPRLGLENNGFDMLLRLLINGRVVMMQESALSLTPEFLRALNFRDLLQMKLSTAVFGAHDLLEHFTEMVRHPRQSIGHLQFCRLFDYQKGIDDKSGNHEWTRRWMEITTVLTRYEAPVSMKYHDFSRYSHILDVGGNSGEFLLRLCRHHAQLRGTVFDLPLVCTIGREHLSGQPEAPRIDFVEGNALNGSIPTGFDAVSFKSMLHDWPYREAQRLLSNGSEALRAGGTLLIFERAPLQWAKSPPGFSTIPMFLFYGAFRPADLYIAELSSLGFRHIEAQVIELDTPFHLITAIKGP